MCESSSDELDLRFDIDFDSDDSDESIGSDGSSQADEVEASYSFSESEDENEASPPDGIESDTDDERDNDTNTLPDHATASTHGKRSFSHRPSSFKDRTASLRERSWSTVHNRVRRVLDVMKEEKINVPIFLDALCWGTPKCISDSRIRSARTALMHSDELPKIIRRMWKPPRSGKTHRSGVKGARSVLKAFALECMEEVREKEMSALADSLRTPANSFVENNLTTVSLQGKLNEMQEHAPTLWQYLYNGAFSKRQKKRNTQKRPEKVVMMTVSMLSYARNHNCNVLQKLFAMYFKFNKISERAYDSLHGLGITMSSTWMSKNIERAASHAMSKVVEEKDILAMGMAHDNVNIPYEVFSQRLNNKSHFDSGTAATVFFFPGVRRLSPSVAHALQNRRRTYNQLTITAANICDHEVALSARLVPFFTYRILYYLLQAPEFDVEKYTHKSSSNLKPPKHLFKLPFGRELATRQYLLETQHMEEASYEGNSQLLLEWLRQLRMATRDTRRRTALDLVIAFIGDQLTCSRMRGLLKVRAEDINSFERLEYLLPIFGWLHLLMAFANSLHKQYIGTTSSHGLFTHAFTLLDRKGLTQTSTKGPFYHDLCKAMEHVLEAHIRVCWLRTAGVSSLADIRNYSPDTLVNLAEKIYRNYASREVLDEMDAQPKQDSEYRNTCSLIRDLLYFSVLKNVGVKCGDVGIMESMLPYLLFRFVGGGSSNYTTEVLELMQGLWKEWPPELVDFVRTSCWLVNFAGKEDSFLPIDLAQEHNIRDIKVTYRPDGPSNGWEYLRKISPAIPTIRATSEHVNAEMKTLSRGKKHTSPSKDADIAELTKAYIASKIHIKGEYRRGHDRDPVLDFVAAGFEKLGRNKILQGWKEKRKQDRSTRETWSDDDEHTSVANQSPRDGPGGNSGGGGEGATEVAGDAASVGCVNDG